MTRRTRRLTRMAKRVYNHGTISQVVPGAGKKGLGLKAHDLSLGRVGISANQRETLVARQTQETAHELLF